MKKETERIESNDRLPNVSSTSNEKNSKYLGLNTNFTLGKGLQY